ncbi:hypothetical protein [Asaia bogorensis]|uniref:hypothetical protein n=1 Tax=Asaia bogorensis TaxID=91915 RepID=UPI00301AF9E9
MNATHCHSHSSSQHPNGASSLEIAMPSVEIIPPDVTPMSDDLFATASALMRHNGAVTFDAAQTRELGACLMRMSLEQHFQERRIASLLTALGQAYASQEREA